MIDNILYETKVIRANKISNKHVKYKGFSMAYYKHGPIIRTGITYKKIPCNMRDTGCRWFIVKRAKLFWSYVKHFWILAGVTKCRILIGLCK